MNNKNMLGFVLGVLFFIACSKEDKDVLTANRINPSDPKIGQISRYVLVRGENYNAGPNAFKYEADTLELTLKSFLKGGWLIEEKLTPGSASRNGKDFVPYPDSTLNYIWAVIGDSLVQQPTDIAQIATYSRLGLDGTKLDLVELPKEKAEIDGWHILFKCVNQCKALDVNYNLFGFEYENVRLYADNRAKSFDGQGVAFAYHPTEGIIKSIRIGSWVPSAIGWDLLAE
jgi:hypothetical protein